MRLKSGLTVVAIFISAAVAVQHAQQQRAQFRAGVEYVQVDVRVADDKGEPIRDLSQADFDVTEDGAPQKISAFSVVDLPLASQTPQTPFAQTAGVRPDVATNVRPPARGRTFLIVFEAGLPERIVGGVKESAGSNPADQIDATGTIGFWSASATRRRKRTTSI